MRQPSFIFEEVQWPKGGISTWEYDMADEKDRDQAATNSQTASEPAQPSYMTANDFNSAMTARERRFEQRLEKMLAERMEGLAKRFAAPAEASSEEAGDESQAETAEASPKRPSGLELQVKKLAAKNETILKQMAAKEEAAAKKEAEILAREMRTTVENELTQLGATNVRAARLLLQEDGRILRNADGDIVMKVTRDYGEDEVPLAAGLKEFLATPDGKHYLPPRGGGEGSGTTIRSGAPRGGQPLSKEEAKREAQKLLTDFVLRNK